MKALFSKFIILFLCLSVSCSGLNTPKDVIPRNSFLKLDKKIRVTVCNPVNPDQCIERGMGATGSGVVVQSEPEGAYVLTAAHVCDNSDLNKLSPAVKTLEYRFKVIDIKGRGYNINLFSMDKESDTCVMFVKGLHTTAASISTSAPEPGDRVYNLAAPMGIFDVYMIPTFEGFYNGETRKKHIYSIPAKGGSSGSPIFNHKGEIVGMISMAFRHFSHLSISPSHKQIVDHVKRAIQADMVRRGRFTIIDQIFLFLKSKNP